MTNRLGSVITTIQPPTSSVTSLVARLRRIDSRLVVIGDKKGPARYDLEDVDFWSLQDQLASEFVLAHLLPTGHYSRKNLGYLLAISQGASSIYETDDDNAPLESWCPRDEIVAAAVVDGGGWINVFRMFSPARIWPRGFPLDEIEPSFRRSPARSKESAEVRAPIQQGLSNYSPDVDAIWRLVLDEPLDFQPGTSVFLSRSAWCPFNSQSTWWFPVAYPLMYLPSHCSFRMTDIWRSFIAQRCLWELDLGVVFHGAEVVQERNAHDLMRDFSDEVPGYEGNKEIVAILEGLELLNTPDAVGENLFTCYEALVAAEFFSGNEITLVRAWLADLKGANCKQRNITNV